MKIKEEINFYGKVIGIFCILWIAIIFTDMAYMMAKRNTDAIAVNTRVIFAVCKRFSRDETIDEQTTQKLASVAKNPKARIVLSQAYELKEIQLKNFCPRAMDAAELESPH